jgi:ribosomal protein S14
MFKKVLKRFERLENTQVDNNISGKKGLKTFKRFERLEINDKKIEFTITDEVAPEEKAPPAIKYYVLCRHCGQENASDVKICGFCKRPIESDYIADYQGKTNILKKCICGAVNLKERKNCWVCGRDFSLWGDSEVSERPENIITLNIDGKIYKSSDENLPPGIIALMEKIRREGYSEKIINDWMQEVNEEVDLRQNDLPSRLSAVRFNLISRIIGLVIFLAFIAFQIRTCSSNLNVFH